MLRLNCLILSDYSPNPGPASHLHTTRAHPKERSYYLSSPISRSSSMPWGSLKKVTNAINQEWSNPILSSFIFLLLDRDSHCRVSISILNIFQFYVVTHLMHFVRIDILVQLSIYVGEKKIRLWVSQWNKMQSQQNINLKISHSRTRTVLSRVCDNPGIISLAHTFILISKFSLSLWNSLSEKGRARNDCGLFQIHLLMLTISYWRETKTEKGK